MAVMQCLCFRVVCTAARSWRHLAAVSGYNTSPAPVTVTKPLTSPGSQDWNSAHIFTMSLQK